MVDGGNAGAFVSAMPDELTAWLGKQPGKPIHLAGDEGDLARELKRGLSQVRGKKTEIEKGEVKNIPASRLTSARILVITIRSFRTGLGVCLFGGNSAARG